MEVTPEIHGSTPYVLLLYTMALFILVVREYCTIHGFVESRDCTCLVQQVSGTAGAASDPKTTRFAPKAFRLLRRWWWWCMRKNKKAFMMEKS